MATRLIELSIDLVRTSSGGPLYTQITEMVEKLSNESLKEIQARVEVDGWSIHSWVATEPLPYDEGYAAAIAGIDADKNPYAEHFWKHNEWWLGWDSHKETNSD